MRILQGIKFKFSPDEPAGGAPAVVTEAAPASEPSASQVEQAADTAAAVKFETDLNASIDKRGTFDKKDVYAKDEKKPEERSLADDIKLEIAKEEAKGNPPPVEKPAEVAGAPETIVAPVEGKAPEAQAPQLFNINGKQVSLEDAVKMADYYDRLTAEIDKSRQDLEDSGKGWKALEAAKSSPEMVLIDYMRQNPAARAKFMELVNNEAPEVAAAHNQTAEQQRIDALEARINTREQTEQNAYQQRQTQQQQEAVANRFISIHQTALAEAKTLELPESVVEEVGHVAVGMANAGKIPKTFESIQDAMSKGLKARAQYAKDVRAQVTGSYIKSKQAAPPPPPTSGANPSIQPIHSGFNKDLVRNVAADLAHALADL